MGRAVEEFKAILLRSANTAEGVRCDAVKKNCVAADGRRRKLAPLLHSVM
jgi:hypothetical protein